VRMAAEEHNRGGSPSESPTKVEHSFDDLARALAEGSISRRRALKLFAGSAIAALVPSRVLAQQQKVTICHKPGTPEEKTIEVSQRALECHQAHGDLQGRCTTTTTSTSTSTTSTSSTTSSTTSTSTSTSTPTTSTSTSTTSTSTTPMCQPNGGSCSTSGECCSGRCSMTGGGFCVPPEGSALLECGCMDGSFLNLCSAACGSDAHPVCVAFCAPHGGLEAERCGANSGCGAS
jgi:hypothetical protein